MDNFFHLLILFFSFYNHYSLCYNNTSLLFNGNSSFLQGIYTESYSYFTTLYLGKEKIPQTYILDTGNYVTSSPCDKCLACDDHLGQKYKLEDESKIIACNSTNCDMLSNVICQSSQCSFLQSFKEGSFISGIYVNESIFFEETLNENISYNIPIGCTTEEDGIKVQSQVANGIMGLGNNNKSFIDILYNSNIIKRKIFSLCYSLGGGYFSIGKIETAFHFFENINYVNLIDINMEKYYIKVNHLGIGSAKIDYNGKASINSGTTLTYFPEKIFRAIMNNYLIICKNCGNLKRLEEYGYCIKVKDEEEMNEIEFEIQVKWEDIIFVLDGYKFIWKPENYIFIYEPEEGELNLCLGFEGDDNIENIILGTTFMRGYDIIFDKEEFRIGFVQADCDRNDTIGTLIGIEEEGEEEGEENHTPNQDL